MTVQNEPFQIWLDRFFQAYYRHQPVNATFIGEQDYDHLLPDYSAQGVEYALAGVARLLKEAAGIDAAQLNAVERMDKTLAEGYLRIQQWELAAHHFHRGNPSLYTGEAIFGVIGLFLGSNKPAADRVGAAVDRMMAIDRLLTAGTQNVRTAPLAWTQRARRECLGAAAFFGPGISRLSEPLTHKQRQELRRAADAALAAFVRYARYLDGVLSRSDSADYACGGDVFDALLREGHGLTQNGDDVAAYATTQLTATHAALAEQAAAFNVQHWRDAFAQLAELHPTIDGYLNRYTQLWAESHELAVRKDLLTWPDFPIEYVPQPNWAREAAPYLYFLFYRAPAAFHRPPVHRYLVTPIEASMPADEQERRLRATNDSVIKLNHVVHHGGIGHHVQNWHAYHGRSRIGQVAAVDCASRIALFCGGTMAEGWACYATTLMGEAGFLTPLEQFSELQTDLRMAARAVVDVRLHQGRMTLEEAAAFYADQTGMPVEAARNEAVKNSMFPGAAMIYLIGRDQILSLREEMKQRAGSDFDLKAFHDKFLSYGSVPVALAAKAMREEAHHAE
ncbi:MAG: DUF885 domain-containing protein [Anaerolineales bacterium]|nr:DUF885 domain-containing protein [Anaerolineales bacterium]